MSCEINNERRDIISVSMSYGRSYERNKKNVKYVTQTLERLSSNHADTTSAVVPVPSN